MSMRGIALMILFIMFFGVSDTLSQIVLQRCDRTNLWTGSNAITADGMDKKEGLLRFHLQEAEPIGSPRLFPRYIRVSANLLI
jgi:hypothetical protein